MLVKLNTVVKMNGQWRQPGELVEVSAEEAQRLRKIDAASAADGAVEPIQEDVDAMRAELARLQEFERQQLAASAEAKAEAEQEEAERKAAESAASKGKAKPDKE